MSTATVPTRVKAEQAQREDVGDKPITYTPFMGKSPVTLTANTVLTLIAKPTKAGKMPTIIQCIRFAKLCEARGLNPWEDDAYLVGYDTKDGPEFNLITAHQAFLKRAETHPDFNGMESGVIVADKDGKLVEQPGDFLANDQTLAGGWARVHFKNRAIPTHRRLNLSTFNSGYSRWAKDPAGMIVKCAEADALRSSFPTSLGGMYLREEFDAMVAEPAREPVPMPRALPSPASAGATLPVAFDPESQIDHSADEAAERSEEPAQERAAQIPARAARTSVREPDTTDRNAATAPALSDDPIEAELVKFCVFNRPAHVQVDGVMAMTDEQAKGYLAQQIKLMAKPYSKQTAANHKLIAEKARAGEWPQWPNPDAD